MNIASSRLYNLHIDNPQPTTPAEVVRHLGALQAQDYPALLWAIGLRLHGATESSIEQAVVDRQIVRTWPMRGTLHFVPAEDIRWMLDLMTPRIIAQSTSRYRELELDDAIFATSKDLFVNALQGSRALTRNQMLDVLERSGITTAGQRGIHILSHLSQQGVLCFAPRVDKQFTFTLLDEWLPQTRILTRDEALATIAERYFTSHGMATLKDFVRWTGLTVADAKAGLESVKSKLIHETIDNETYWYASTSADIAQNAISLHLLPAFDEYLVGYKDRSPVLSPQNAKQVIPGSNGMFKAVLVIGGQVVGTWKRIFRKNTIIIEPTLFRPLTHSEQEAFVIATQRYADFLELSLA